MNGLGRYHARNPGQHDLEHHVQFFITRGSKNQDEFPAREILVERFNQPLHRISVMGGIGHDGWFSAQQLEACRPYHLPETVLDCAAGEPEAGLFEHIEGCQGSDGIFHLMPTKQRQVER